MLWTIPLAAGFVGPAVLGGNGYLLDRDEKIGDTLHFGGGAQLPQWAIPAGFKPPASAVILEPGDKWAPLALVGGKLPVRG